MLVANPNNALLQKAGNRRGLPHVATQPASAAVRLGPYVLRTAPFNRGNEYVIRAVRADDPTGKLYDITVCPKPEQSANDKQSTTPSNNNPTTSFFENELHVHRTLARHPCIIAAVDAFENDLFTFIVHEARDVDTDLLKCLTTQGALAEATARVVFIQLAGAIAHSHHRGVVHRDIKLPAIFINSTQKRAYLTGFSYATVLKDQASMLHDRRGSPAYVCPEMLQNKTYDGKAADVWSLAVVLYVMLSGTYPFVDRDPKTLFTKIVTEEIQLPSKISSSAADLLGKMFCRDPLSRATIEMVLAHPWTQGPHAEHHNDREQMVPSC